MTMHLRIPMTNPTWRLEEEQVSRPAGEPPTYSLCVDGSAGTPSAHFVGLSIDSIQMLQFALCKLRQEIEGRARVAAQQLAEMQRLGLEDQPPAVRIAGADCTGLPRSVEPPVFAGEG